MKKILLTLAVAIAANFAQAQTDTVTTGADTAVKSIMYLEKKDLVMQQSGFYLERAGKRLGKSIYFPIIGSLATYVGYNLYLKNTENPLPGIFLTAVGVGFNLGGFVSLVGAAMDLNKAGKAMRGN